MRYKAEGDLGGDDESLKNSSRLRPPDGSSTTTSPFVWYDKTATRGLKGFERRFKALKDFEICLKALTDVYRRLKALTDVGLHPVWFHQPDIGTGAGSSRGVLRKKVSEPPLIPNEDTAWPTTCVQSEEGELGTVSR